MGVYIKPPKATDERETPDELFLELDKEFHFTLDVCATPENAKCHRYFTVADNGLEQNWGGEVCWMNPPYSQTGKWMEKALRESHRGATVVCLVPAATDTKWWHEIASNGQVRFIRGRLRFKGMRASAPFPSVIVIFRAYNARFPREVA